MQSYLLTCLQDSFIDHYIKDMKDRYTISDINTHIFSSETSVTIEMVRTMQTICSRKPLGGGSLLIVIKNIDCATTEAANALLKLLEEPPAFAYILLTATNIHKILPTIISRSHIVHDKHIVAIDPTKMEKIKQQFQTIISSSPGQRIVLSQKIAASREDTLTFLVQLLYMLEPILVSDIPEIPLAKKEIATIIQKIIYAQKYIESNVNHKLVLDVLFLGYP